MSWDVVKFGELYAIPSRNGLMRPSRERGSGFKMINMGELFAYPIIRNPEMERVQVSDNELPKYTVQSGDLLFARQSLVLEGAGKCSIVESTEDPTVYESHLIRVRLNKEVCDPFFYYCFFSSQVGAGFIQQIVNQVAAAGIRGSDLEKLKVIHPPLPAQQKIAAILSAYDDLIENNNKRIALLEKAAEEIYREWFVRMRFAGWEKVKFVKDVPEGWEVKKIKEIVNRIPFGRIYRGHELSQSGNTIVIDQSTEPYLGFYDGEPEHKASPEEPIILFGDHSCKMELMMRPFSLAENVVPFTSKNAMPVVFLFYLIKGIIETTEYKRHWTELANKELYIPSSSLQNKFAKIVSNHLIQIKKLQESNRQIVVMRDLLLSRLISGKLSVEGLDVRFPPSMSAGGESARDESSG